jgi:hypothetical protein
LLFVSHHDIFFARHFIPQFLTASTDGAVQSAVTMMKFADVVQVGGPFESRPQHLLL